MTAMRQPGKHDRNWHPGTTRGSRLDDDLVPPVAAADPHLLDTDFGGALTEPQGKHLACCGWCQQRFSQSMTHPDLTDDAAFVAAVRERARSEDGAALMKFTTLRPELHLLATGHEPRDDVKAGQLWRLRWRDTTEVALAIAVDRWWVTVAPVTTDVGAADEHSIIVPATSTVLGVPAAVCFSLECVVPMFTFDQLIAQAGRAVPADGDRRTQLPPPHALRDVWRAWRRGTTSPRQLTYGQSLLDGDLDRHELRATLAAGFMPLIGAGALAPGTAAVQPPTTLREMLECLRVPPGELAARSPLQPEVFRRVARGGRVTSSEAHALACIFDTDPDTVLAANPPLDEDLVVEVCRPRWRPDLRHLANLRQTSEDDERWGLADAAAVVPLQAVSSESSTETRADQSGSLWEPVVAAQLRAELAAHGNTAAAGALLRYAPVVRVAACLDRRVGLVSH